MAGRIGEGNTSGRHDLSPRELLNSFDQYDRKLQGEDRFHFIPFAEQPEPVKLHYIDLTPLLDFSEFPLPDVTDATCEAGHPFRAERGEFATGWGDIDQLTLIIKDVPQMHCDCKVFDAFLEDPVARPILGMSRMIRIAVETEDEEALAQVRAILPHDDAEKVFDFTFNRRIPSDRTPSYIAQPLKRLSQTITLSGDDYKVSK